MACVLVPLFWINLVAGLLNMSPVQSSDQLLYVYIDSVSGEDNTIVLHYCAVLLVIQFV